MKKIILILLSLIILLISGYYLISIDNTIIQNNSNKTFSGELIEINKITTFEECAEAGNEVLEMDPPRCFFNGSLIVKGSNFIITHYKNNITSFEECANAGFPVEEGNPRTCYTNGMLFTEEN